jgi:MobA/MobL family
MKASKAVEMQDRFMNRAAYTTNLRESWANLANRYLEKFGHEARIDHRSYQAQGLDREPTIHLGPGDAERERQGIRTPAGDHNREVQARNAERERQALDRAVAERHDPGREAGIVQSAQPAPTVATIHDRRRREQQTHEAKSTKAFEHAPGSFPAGMDAMAANWALRATVEDLAKELSPKYRQALEKVAELEKEFKEAARAHQSAALDGQQARSRQGTRREAIGGLRRFMHDRSLWKDADLQRWEKRERGAAYGEKKRGIEVATLRDQLAAARWTAEAEREAIHDRAQAELRARRDAAIERLAPRDRLDVLRWYDHKAAGLAPIELADVAREISPAYRRAAAAVAGLAAELQRAEYAHGRAERDAAVAHHQTDERRQALGITERDLAKGRFADLELTNAASKELGADFTEQQRGMRIEAVREQLVEAEKRANEEFDRVKPEAEVELMRRQQIAHAAREQLRPIQQAEQLQRQQQRQLRRQQTQGFGR